MKNKLLIIPALALLGVTATAGYTTYAAGIGANMPNLTVEQRQEFRQERVEHRENMRTLIDSEDYESFVEAIEGTPVENIIDTRSKFNILVEAHGLREEGDHDGARELMSQLGFERPGQMQKHKRGFRANSQ